MQATAISAPVDGVRPSLGQPNARSDGTTQLGYGTNAAMCLAPWPAGCLRRETVHRLRDAMGWS